MAIEIREILIRATVRVDNTQSKDVVTKADLRKERRQTIEECMDRVRDLLDDYRTGR